MTGITKAGAKSAKGASFVIAKSGKPMVTVIPYSDSHTVQKRIGFLKDQITIPDDFYHMGQGEIAAMFEGKE
jgi:antitoxin (DNA-binding transcriptional repressor) of toxin-antitoxin stability system